MKRFLLIIACLLQVISASSQRIQDTFFGLQLGKLYNKEHIVAQVGERGTYLNESVETNGSKVSFYDVTFGGASWNTLDIYLLKPEQSTAQKPFGVLYSVNFISRFVERDRCIEQFDSLYSTLVSKYGTPAPHDTVKNFYFFTCDDLPNAASLSWERAESVGGDYFYYLTLSYFHMEYLSKKINKDRDEL